MRVGSVEWTFQKSPELIIESWSVAATIEAILRVQVRDRKEVVEAFLGRTG
ncbi:MAG: hypothetical protein LN416_01675 [Candidatus Thermoplasmatota archaeon]|nr:hypothetical protein [Candidatus Thermoplasmatota archaeon]